MLTEGDSDAYPRVNPRSSKAARQRRKVKRLKRMTKVTQSASGTKAKAKKRG